MSTSHPRFEAAAATPVVADSPVRPSSARWPALDGMRGLMTIGVFVAHVSYEWLPGAILFMDAFFMMSSFFITRLLLKDWHTDGRIHYASFYVRRLRRLYPALLAMVIPIALFFVVGFGHRASLLLNVAGTLFYFANWLRAFGVPHQNYIGHTWSLSIEEQYYLLWPAIFGLLLALSGRGVAPAAGKRPLRLAFWAVALGGVMVATMAWRSWLALHGANWERMYNGTDMHLDSLALGALLAITFDTRPVQAACAWLARPWLVWAMVAVMVWGAARMNVVVPAWYAWQQHFYVLLSLALIMSFLKTPTGWGLRFAFQNPVSLYLGAICYGLYLWHYPLIYICHEVFAWPVWKTFLVCAPLSLALASLSYFLLELPALNGNRGSAK
ncbi:O-acetyltransferase OatA [Luteitalea pratensis]|uniref:O-acetyltransferase OatA n=1 Tax=Luteitalea pratensis TaxID=1855912 RepID=A0A143PT16_LUTPR|nr:acyltransferase [Luteitalea pratensis]AMY11303.1 O-acetyltransferase OatA [Luteitalea pratensis]